MIKFIDKHFYEKTVEIYYTDNPFTLDAGLLNTNVMSYINFKKIEKFLFMRNVNYEIIKGAIWSSNCGYIYIHLTRKYNKKMFMKDLGLVMGKTVYRIKI